MTSSSLRTRLCCMKRSNSLCHVEHDSRWPNTKITFRETSKLVPNNVKVRQSFNKPGLKYCGTWSQSPYLTLSQLYIWIPFVSILTIVLYYWVQILILFSNNELLQISLWVNISHETLKEVLKYILNHILKIWNKN